MKFLKKFWLWITGKKKKIAEAAVKVMDLIKQAIENPLTAKVVEFIPGDVDDKLLEKLKVLVPQVAVQVASVNTLLQAKGTPEEIVAQYVKYIQTVAPSLRPQQYQSIVGHLIANLSDGKISFAEGMKLGQETYDLLKEKGIVK